MRARVDEAREARDTLGGVFEVRVLGLPPGLGSHASGPERLTARLGGALLSIPAMKGVEFGLGFEAARRPGSQVHDPIRPEADGPWGRFRRDSNRAGGLEGGLTTGEPLICRVAMKPISSLLRGLPTVDFETGEAVRATYQRSDVVSVPAASVVGEAVCALVLGARLPRDLRRGHARPGPGGLRGLAGAGATALAPRPSKCTTGRLNGPRGSVGSRPFSACRALPTTRFVPHAHGWGSLDRPA